VAVRRFFEPTPSAFPCVIHDTFYDSNTSVSLKYNDDKLYHVIKKKLKKSCNLYRTVLVIDVCINDDHHCMLCGASECSECACGYQAYFGPCLVPTGD